ncbi:MAG: hypothetical protein AB8F95_10840 [Bacteroidia bacterium]
MERIALIDLGTNTFHLLIAEIKEREQWVDLAKYKTPVKLGEGGMPNGAICTAAYERGMNCLEDFKKVVDAAGVTTVLAFATSAIRSATNGRQFVSEAYEKTGIRIRVINGNEEASLIHEGVKNGVRLPKDQPVLLVDIGGGSVEFIVSLNGETLLLRSLDVGAARLLSVASPSDPIREEEFASLHAHLHEQLAGLIDELKEFELKWLVGSSGTFESLAALAAYKNGDVLSAEQLNGYRFSTKQLHAILDQIVGSTRAEREAMRGMDPLRIDMIVVGAALIRYMSKALELEQCMVSSSALKDGMLHRHLREQKSRMQQFMGHVDRDVRAKSVQNLALRYHYDRGHSLQVSELATQLFQGLSPWHEEDDSALELLQYSAVLFNIGHYINASSHHKHGLYIIMNVSMSGFSTNELVQLANIVRYHRKSLPKQNHYHWSIMGQEAQQRVLLLGGILRLAINLDRGRRKLINRLEVELLEGEVKIVVFAPENVEMEIAYAGEQCGMLEHALGCRIAIEQG